MIWKYIQLEWKAVSFPPHPFSGWFYKTLESSTSAGWAQQRAPGVVLYSLPLKGRMLPSTQVCSGSPSQHSPKTPCCYK